ncbi:hypothetical protein [Streptomyces sp. NPDC059533]|uniref:hypothetical protein n=1 Tax=unclassified Streptomyces TaxID=2593676 RepID=UPI00369C9871
MSTSNAEPARLAAQVHSLEGRLGEELGEQVWREVGIRGPDDTEQLKAEITTLEQQVVDPDRKLQERDDLAAACAARRGLMVQLNHHDDRAPDPSGKQNPVPGRGAAGNRKPAERSGPPLELTRSHPRPFDRE